MDEKIKSWIHDIINRYFKIYDLTPEYQINDSYQIEELEKHVKEVLVIHYSYKEKIPNLKITIQEILAEETF